MAALLFISTMVSLTLGVWLINQANSDDLEGTIDLLSEPDYVNCWFAEAEGLEILLRPFYAEENQDAFNEKQLNELLNAGANDYGFAKLWFLNLGKKEREFDTASETEEKKKKGFFGFLKKKDKGKEN